MEVNYPMTDEERNENIKVVCDAMDQLQECLSILNMEAREGITELKGAALRRRKLTTRNLYRAVMGIINAQDELEEILEAYKEE